MNLLALTALVATLVTPSVETCARGCTVSGPCYVLLASYIPDPGPSPSPPPQAPAEAQWVYIGEPYSSRQDAACGAQRLRQRGICVAPGVGAPGDFVNYSPVTVTIVKADGHEPPFPGFDDCDQIGEAP